MENEANDNNNSLNNLLNLLADGEEEMRRLSFQLNEPQHTSAIRVQNIFSQVITIVTSMDPTGMRQMPSHSHIARSGSSGRSGSGSPSEASERTIRRRKDVPKRTVQVPATTPNNGQMDAAPDDTYSWRKYGQKNILHAKFPRSYYRCTFQRNQNCQALKHVQRSDKDPSIFVVTYQGEHTCTQNAGQTSLTQSLEDQLLIPAQNEFNQQCMIEFDKPYPTIETHKSCQDEQGKIHSPSFSISSAQPGLRSDSSNVFSPSSSFGGPFSSGYGHSGASDSNYLPLPVFPSDFGGDFGSSFHGSEYGLNDVVSMPHSGTSATYDFNIEQPTYPFNSPHPFN